MRAARVTLAIAIAFPVLARGGYSSPSRSLFAVAVALALFCALAVDEDAPGRFARTPAVLILLALAVLSAASAAWTIGAPRDALRWALVIAAYGGLVVAAATVLSKAGEERDPGGLLALLAGAGGRA